MTKKVLLHVGTPKTGTSYLQDVLFQQPATAAPSTASLPRRPVRRPLPGRARPDAAAVGRARGRGHRRLGPARRSRSATAHGDRDHQPRDPRHRVARRRSAARSSRSATADGTEVHLVLSVRDLVRQIPAEWQENVKHRAALSLRRGSSSGSRTPRATAGSPSWFWSVQEVPDILDRWGEDLPPEQRPPGDRAAPGRRARPAVEAVLAGVRPRGHRPGPRGRAGQPVARRPRDGPDPPDQPRGQRRARARRLPPAGPRAARPPDAVAPDAVAAAGPAARRAPVGERARGGVDRGDPAPRVRRRRRPRRPARQPAGAPVRRPRPAATNAVAGAAVDAIKALLLDNARMRSEEARLQAELDDAPRALERSYLRPSYRLRAEGSCVGSQASRAGRGAAEAYRRARGRSSRSA